MKDRTKKTTPVHINLDLHKRAKIAAITRNIGLQELVENALEIYLRPQPSNSSHAHRQI